MKRRGALVPVACSVAAALLMAAWGTWPIAAHLRTAVYDPARSGALFSWALRSDVYLTLWIPAWDVHALVSAPWGLFDANIFHPARGTLALAEHMLGILPIYAPLMLVSGDPVLAHQATLLLTFACAFLFALALVREWTASWPAAVLAGALYAFSTHRMYGLAGLQAESDFYLPLVPLCLRRAWDGRSPRWGIALASVLLLQSLASLYLAYAAFLAAGIFLITGMALDRRTRPGAARVIVWIAVAGMAVAAAGIPYLRKSASGSIVAATGEWLALVSADVLETGANAAALLALATLPFCRRALKPGIGSHWIAGLLLVAVFGHAVALGPEVSVFGYRLTGPYALLAHAIPGFAAVRNPGRLNALAALGFASVAGIGVAGVINGIRDASFRRLASWAAVVGALVVVGNAVAKPVPTLGIETRRTVPPVYRWLATAPPGPVVEIPFWDFNFFPFAREVEAQRVYRSVYHWHPLLNGYSGYTPPTYAAVSALVRALPDPRAATLLARATGLRYIVVHRRELSRIERGRWRDRSPALSVVVTSGADVVLTLRDAPAPDLVSRLLRSRGSPISVLGTPLEPLPPGGRQARLTLARAPSGRVYGDLAFDVDVLVENTSHATWPGLTIDGEHVVAFVYRWLDASGSPLTADLPANRIPFDLAPGEAVRVPVPVVASGATGPRQLVIGLQQGGRWFSGELRPIPITVVGPGGA